MINIENMAIRTSLLNGNNISRDADFSKYIETVSEPWVIQWLTVTSSQVAIWKARVPCERTNGETIYALVTVSTPVSISWNGDVYIEVSQTYIDDWELANEDWTGIATISVWTMPNKNALKLAEKNWSTITDARNVIAKVWELNTYIQSLNTRMNIAEQEIDELIADSATDCLEEAGLIWEKYTLADSLFRQKTPVFSVSTTAYNIWDVDWNKQVHIQRIWSWTPSNKLKISAKKIWAPTTWLVVEVRRWVEVDVSNTEAYWYWGDLVCSWSIWYASFTTDFQEFEITMSWQFWGTKWELLDVVVYQTGNIVNSTNYYAVACDSSQFSEWFSLVAVNWNTRTRSKLMPYCISDWFASALLCKTSTAWSWTAVTQSFSVSTPKSWEQWTWTLTYTTTQTYTKMYITVSWVEDQENYHWNENARIVILVWWTQKLNRYIAKNESWSETVVVNNVSSWTVITTNITAPTGWGNAGSYWWHTIRWTVSYSASQSWVIRPLIATELKEIWQQWVWMSYWRREDWTRYWEFDWTVHNSATTWSVTLWNCIWFKVITDANGEKYKIPIYWM